jgi:hypothetical protein
MTKETKNHKAILIDVKNREVKTVEYKDYKDMQKLIGCNCFTTAYTFPNEDTLFVDDEGLLNGTEHFFYFEGAHQPFAGNGLIVGKEILDEEGDLIDTANPSSWSEWMKGKIKWLHINDVREMAAKGEL